MFEPVVISTGQHELMVDEILAMAGTVADGHLDVGTGYESLNARVSNEMGRFEEFFTRRGCPGVARGLLVAHVYAFYSWLLWPVLLRSTARQLTERRDWAKTEREPVS